MKYKLINNVFFFIIYIYAYYSFFSTFILPVLEPNRSIVFLLLDTLFLILGIMTIRSLADKVFFGIFIVLTLLSQIYNQYYDQIQYLNGFREFIPVFCAPFIVKYLIDTDDTIVIDRFNKFLKVFLILQIPVSILQYAIYGPGDDVGGTLGLGFSGTITIIIYISTFYIFRYENLTFSLKDIKKLFFIFACWIPTFINETKISFILLPLFFLFQLKLNRSQIIKSILFVGIFLPLIFFVLLKVYNSNDRYNSEQFDQEYVTNYLFGDESETYSADSDLPRFLRLQLGIQRLSENTYSILLGKGLGQFKGGTTVDKTEFAIENADIMGGSIIYIFFVLLQLGFLGLILLIMHIFRFIVKEREFLDKNTAIFFFIITSIAITYGTTFRGAFFSFIFFFIILISKKPDIQLPTDDLSDEPEEEPELLTN